MARYLDRQVARARNLRLARSRLGAGRDPLSAELAGRQLEGLGPVRLPGGALLDLGCGVAAPPAALAAGRRTVRMDWVDWPARSPAVVADAHRLPFRDAAFGIVWANLCLPWLDDLPAAMGEARRVLAAGGLFCASTLGPGTLAGLAAAAGGPTPRVLGFVDMHDLADMLGHCGFAEPVAVRETLALSYPDPAALLDELRTFGVLCQAGMARHLGHRRALKRIAESVAARAEFEIIYIHAWAVQARPPKGPDGWQEVVFQQRQHG